MHDDVGQESIGTRIISNDSLHDLRVKPKFVDVKETTETRQTWSVSNPNTG